MQSKLTSSRLIDAFADRILARIAGRDAAREGEYLRAERAEGAKTLRTVPASTHHWCMAGSHAYRCSHAEAQRCVSGTDKNCPEHGGTRSHRWAAVGYHSPLAAAASSAGGVASLVRNLADGMKAGDWDKYATRQMLDRVHKRLIDWTYEGCDDARFMALKDARGIITRAIIQLCREG